jgi:hypothetical protein
MPGIYYVDGHNECAYSELGKEFWARVSVICPGNFVHVSILGVDGNYGIANRDAFLKTFFEVFQQHPFAPPAVKAKPFIEDPLSDGVEFLFRKVAPRLCEIDCERFRFREVKFRNEVVPQEIPAATAEDFDLE